MDIVIANQKFVLDNGLTLIVHEDHKAPIAAFNIWYHVGSKNERLGKTGFAHLFEHLMFNGSEHHDDDFFKPFEAAGATDQNGTTDYDRTNYFENVPTPALDVALWMESDRMGHLLGALTQAKLDEQRGVVQNELRQGENQPYGKVEGIIARNTYPYGHPYSWDVGGSIEDLERATLSDVQEWFKTYYGPANAVIVLAGDIDPQTAKAKVEKYFGSFAGTTPLTRHRAWIAKRTGTVRQQTEDRVPQSRIYKVWNIPEWGSATGDYLSLAADLLGSGKNSRLYKRLVYDEQIATDVSAYADLREIGGQFVIRASAQPGGDLARVEKALDEELARFLARGPEKKELQRIQIQFEAGFIRGSERIGGFGGKSDILASNQVFKGDPDFYRHTLQRVRQANLRDVWRAAQEWLSDGVYILEVHPFSGRPAKGGDADRSRLPAAGPAPDVRFPSLQKQRLTNGLQVVLAERHAVPLVQFSLLVNAGFAADPPDLPGTARLTMAAIDEGTRGRSALQISEELELLGAELSAAASLDVSLVSLSALKSKLEASLQVYADVILHPAFPQKELSRLQKQMLAAIQQEKSSPMATALRLLPRFLYGREHAYSQPLTGSGTEESVSRLRRDDLLHFYQTWFKPGNATLLVVGDVTPAEIVPQLEKLFSEWPPGSAPQKNIPPVPGPETATLYLVDKPGAPQSLVIAGQLAPAKANPDEIAIETMNTILGGAFTSRLNMNLREDKHWSYGAYSFIPNARGQRPLFVYAPVQTDKTAETVREILAEIRQFQDSKPVSAEELERAQNNQTRQLPGSWETADAVLASIGELITFGLADDYYATYPQKVLALSRADISAIARKLLRPDRLVWIVVGDRAKIEKELAGLGLGPVRLLDANGNPVL